ncbi:MAG TPA: hypothetical protein VIT00_10100, partial [Terrimicrobiaceae bacterium]
MRGAQSLRRRLKHRRPVADVEEIDVHDIRVRRKKQRLGIHKQRLGINQPEEYENLVVLHVDIEKVFTDGRRSTAAWCSRTHQGVGEVPVVIDL